MTGMTTPKATSSNFYWPYRPYQDHWCPGRGRVCPDCGQWVPGNSGYWPYYPTTPTWMNGPTNTVSVGTGSAPAECHAH